MKKNHIFTQTENINFYFEFKTNNKIQCFFLFQIVRLHSKQRCGTFLPLFTMVDKFVSVKYWSSQKSLRLWTLWFCECGSLQSIVVIVESTSFRFRRFVFSLPSILYLQLLQIAYTHSWFGVNACAQIHNGSPDPQYTNEAKSKIDNIWLVLNVICYNIIKSFRTYMFSDSLLVSM